MVRAWSVLILGLLLASALPHASSTDPPSLLADQEDVFLVDSSASLSFRPDGNGWGRIVLEATEEVTLQLALDHETFDDLSIFSNDGDGIYNATVYTFLYLFPEGTHPYNSGWSFEWWGNPWQSWWPHPRWETFGAEPVELAPGERAVLLVADRVGGYIINITSAAPGDATEVAWTLGEHNDLQVFVPPEERNSRLAAGPVRVRESSWDAHAAAPSGAVIKAGAWEHEEGPGVIAQVYQDAYGWRQGPQVMPLVDLPGFEISTGGGWSDHQSTRTAILPEATELDFYRERSEAGARTQFQDIGAQFLVLPTGPLS